MNIPLTLRIIKGSKLTFAELDTNFVSLKNAINTVNNSLDNYLPLTGGTLTGSLSATTYFGDGSNLSGISFSGQSLSQTLSIGNNSGFNDIIMDNNHVIKSNSGNFLDLRSLDDNKVKLSTNGNQNLTLKYGGTGKTTSTYCLLANDGENFTDAYLYLEEENYAQLARYRTGDTTYYGFNLYGNNTYQQYSTGVSIKDNQINSFTSANKNNPAIIIGSKNSTITSGVTNSVVIGGENILATQNNTVYVPNLNIGESDFITFSGVPNGKIGKLSGSGEYITISKEDNPLEHYIIIGDNVIGSRFEVSNYKSGNKMTSFYTGNGSLEMSADDVNSYLTCFFDGAYLELDEFNTIASNVKMGVINGFYNNEELLIWDNTTNNRTSRDTNKKATFIGTRNSTITSGVTNSVVIGGSGITVTQSDSVYLSKPIIISASAPSSTADSSGVQGEIRYDDDWLYVKTSAGWKRSGLTSF